MSLRRTAVHHWAQQAGAAIIEHHGWEAAGRFSDPKQEAAQVSGSAGLADVSWTAKFDLKGQGLEALPALGAQLRSWLLGPQHVLVTCGPGERESAAMELSHAERVWVTDVTSVYAEFLLAGPRSRDILAKLTSLNVSERALPDFGCAQTSLSHVHATILRQDLGALQAFHLLVSRDYGEDVWESIMHAGREFHIAPFGLEALAMLGG